MWWLTTVRQRSGQSTVDFDKMCLHDLLRLVPDQMENATGLRAFGIETAGALARTIRAPPLLSTCNLCLLDLVIRYGNAGVLQDVQNASGLLAVAKEHQEKYGIPPSLDWVVKTFISRRASQTGIAAPEQCEAKPCGAIPQGTSSSTDLRGAASKTQAVTKPGGATKRAALAPGEQGVGTAPGDAVPKDVRNAGKPAAQSSGLRDGRPAKDSGPTTVKWHPTEPANHARDRCVCSGNCHGNCLGRKWGTCPNVVVVGQQFCAACKCRHPGCSNNARRPFGSYLFEENRGYCKTHYVRQC